LAALVTHKIRQLLVSGDIMNSKKAGKGNGGTQKSSVDQGTVPNGTQPAATTGAVQSINAGSTDPFDYLQGILPEKLSAVELVARATKIGLDLILRAYGLWGKLFYFAPFKGEWRAVLHGNPMMNPVFKEVLAHKDSKMYRQHYINALLAEAVAQEWNEKGYEFADLDWTHRPVLGTVKDDDLRLMFAKRAQDEGLSAKQLQNAIRNHMAALGSPNSAHARNVTRRIKTMVDLLKDKDAQALLADRRQLEMIDDDSRMELLKYSKQARTIAVDISKVFGQVSETIIDIEASTRSSQTPPQGVAQPAQHATQSAEDEDQDQDNEPQKDPDEDDEEDSDEDPDLQ
jgi:hypothetical protein